MADTYTTIDEFVYIGRKCVVVMNDRDKSIFAAEEATDPLGQQYYALSHNSEGIKEQCIRRMYDKLTENKL